MPFQIILLPSAEDDLIHFKVYEQRIILTGIATHLSSNATVTTKRRKQLAPNAVAPWELRIDHYRIFYEVIHDTHIHIVAIGHKVHNDLYIRGKKVII